MIIKVDAPKYFVEVSVDWTVSRERFMKWAKDAIISEQGSETGISRWYCFPYSNIRMARRFANRVRKEFKDCVGARIFKSQFTVHENHQVVT